MDTLQKWVRLPATDVAGIVGFAILTLIVVAIAMRVGPVKKIVSG